LVFAMAYTYGYGQGIASQILYILSIVFLIALTLGTLVMGISEIISLINVLLLKRAFTTNSDLVSKKKHSLNINLTVSRIASYVALAGVVLFPIFFFGRGLNNIENVLYTFLAVLLIFFNYIFEIVFCLIFDRIAVKHFSSI